MKSLNRIKYFTVVTIVAMLGFIGAVLVHPTYKELAWMYFSDKQFEESYRHYHKLFKENDFSIPVVQPLAKTYLEMGNDDKAIEVLEKFVAQNPMNTQALESLTGLYEDANRYRDLLYGLQELNSKKPSERYLKKILELQKSFDDELGMAETLELLIEMNSALENEYLYLARYYAAKGDFTRAINVLISMVAQFSPIELSDDALTTMIAMFADGGYRQVGEEVAKKSLAQYPTPERAVDIAYALMISGSIDAGLEILNTLPEEMKKSSKVSLALLNLYSAKKIPEKELYFLLKNQLTTDPSDLDFLDRYLHLAGNYEENSAWLRALVRRMDLKQLSESTILSLLKRASNLGDKELLNALLVQLKSAYFKNHPMLTIAFLPADSRYSPTETNFLLEEYIHKTLSLSEKIKAARYFLETGNPWVATDTLNEITSIDGIRREEIIPLMLMYANLNLVDQGIKLHNDYTNKSGEKSKESDGALLILKTAKGLTEDVLRNVNAKDSDLLTHLTSIAIEKRNPDLSLPLAKMLWNLNKSDEAKGYLAEGFILNNEYEEALPLVRELAATNKAFLPRYIETLSKLSKTNSNAGNELESILPQILESLETDDETRRNIGYVLLDNNNKADAAKAFKPLAVKGALFSSGDVEVLLSIWGEKPGAKEVEWIIERTKNSNGKEKGDWLNHLLYIGEAKSVKALVGKEELLDEGVANAFLGALSQLKEKQEIADAIDYILPEISLPQRMKHLGKLAQDEGLKGTAISVWKKILSLEPEDMNADVQLGAILFSMGKYSEAQIYLRSAIAKGSEDYLAYYYYAEALTANKCKKEACRYYKKTLKIIQNLKEKSLNSQSIEAACYVKLKCDRRAETIYSNLYFSYPDNTYVRMDFAVFLMERERFKEASRLLSGSDFPDTKNASPEELIDLELVRIRLLKETQDYCRALRKIKNLARDHPCNAKVIAAVADVSYAYQNWRSAMASIRKAQSLDPENQAYYAVETDIIEEHLPWVGGCHEWKKTGFTQMENIDRYHVSRRGPSYTETIAELESDYVHVQSYLNAKTGLSLPYKGQKWRGLVAMQKPYKNGITGRGNLFFGEQVIGGGLYLYKVDPFGKWGIEAEYHRPYWDFVELLIQNGSRDSIGFLREQRLMYKVKGIAGMSYNRYNLPHMLDVATSIRYNLGLTCEFPKNKGIVKMLGDDASFSFNYLIDSEYHLTLMERESVFGTRYNPIAMTDRETHTWFYYMSKRFLKVLSLEGFAGLSYDRAQGGMLGPVGGLNAVFGNKSGVEGRIEVSHTPSTDQTAQDVNRLILDLRVAY